MNTHAKQILGMLMISLTSALNIPAAFADDPLNPWLDNGPVPVPAPLPLPGAHPPVPPFPPFPFPLPSGGNNHQPHLAPTTTSATIPYTHFAPGNIALKQLGHGLLPPVLPPTMLTSFVADSGMSDDIYGHEGQVENEVFQPIENGFDIVSQFGLTTGHLSDAPSLAYPQ